MFILTIAIFIVDFGRFGDIRCLQGQVENFRISIKKDIYKKVFEHFESHE